MHRIPFLSGGDVARLISPRDAADAISGALRAGLDPASDPRRSVLDVRSGQLLLMPSESAACVGVKAVTVAPGNPRLGLPRVHGAYLLFSAATLELVAILDGAAISSIRTPAVSIAGSRPAFARFDRPVRVTVFGAGPQAAGHVDALVNGGFARVEDVVHVVRHPERAGDAVEVGAAVMAAGDPAVAARVSVSDVLVCTTTSATPLFDSQLVGDRAVVLVVGAHEPHNREVDGRLLARSTVVVEDPATALREAGDVVLAVAEGLLDPASLVPMADVVRGAVEIDHARPYVLKTVGMSWEDLAVAEVVLARLTSRAGA